MKSSTGAIMERMRCTSILLMTCLLLGACTKQESPAASPVANDSPAAAAEHEVVPEPLGPLPPGEVVGQLLWDATPLRERTEATVSLWIRDESQRKAVKPKQMTLNDRFQLSGLAPGRYLIVATLNANPDNGMGHPGDFYGSTTVDLGADEGLRVSLEISEMIRLVEPQDNDRGIEGWGTSCGAKQQLAMPTEFAWRPIQGEVDYRYTVYPGSGGSAVAEGNIGEPRIALDLPANDPGECYRFHLSAYRDGRRIGTLMTHGTHGGRAGFYEFRVGELPAEQNVSPRFDGSTPLERWDEPLIALSFDEGFDGPGLRLAVDPENYRWVEGPGSRALWLEGGIEWAEDPAVELPGNYTLSLLIRPDELPPEGHSSILRSGLMHLDHSGQSQHLAVLFPGGGHMSISLNPEKGWIETGAWQHLVIVKNVGLSVWINGEQVHYSSTRSPVSMRLESLRLGSRSHDREPWRGAFDELRIWDRALTQDEVAALTQQLRWQDAE